MSGPSRTQLQLLRFVRSSHAKQGFAPSITEICEHFRWKSTNAAAYHLSTLRKSGLVSSVPGTPRSLTLTPEGLKAIGGAA